ncbi:MAG: hypothetical protein KF799_12000 [Bdellovibrionales bacterium]|nr:hypothetical protein [Bdellovibrionales bacterium]
MKIISRLRDERFCAFCRSPRRLYVKKHVDLTNVLGVLLVTGALTHVLWGGPDPRGVVLFMTFIVTGEVFIYLRWRASIVCRMCGFDPLIYKKSPERAAKAVNQFFKEQAENPAFWMSKSPLLEVHRRLKEDEKRREDVAAVRKHVAAKKANALASKGGTAPIARSAAPTRPAATKSP